MINNQDLIIKAWFFASHAHKEQKYPGQKLPYITHIGNVVLELMGAADSLENLDLAICCAILHDTIEDTKVTYQDIEKEFGKTVADGVAALSKDVSIGSKEQQMQDSLNRIKKQPKEVWSVKMADRIANLGEPPHYWSRDKKESYLKESKVILANLQEANSKLANRLSKKIENYSNYF